MKKVLVLTLALCLIVAGVALATVVSTKHDMRPGSSPGTAATSKSAAATTTQVCVFCHHPHRGSNAVVTTVLLWNISDATNTYTTYMSPTINSTGLSYWDTVSLTLPAAQYTLLCMGCHDGAGASNSYVKNPVADGALGTPPVIAAASAANLGASLQDDHPVDFAYQDAADGIAGLEDIRPDSGGYVVGPIGTNATYPLYSNTMQCATCHDVHAGQSPRVQFMRGGTVNVITDSKICRDCHTAK